MKCNHQNTKEILTPELQHYAKLVCSDCGTFLRWMPSPEAAKRLEALHSARNSILEKNPGERNVEFLASLTKRRFFMTEKQQSWWDSLCTQYGIENPTKDR